MRIRTLAQVVVVGMVVALVGTGSAAQSAGEPGVVHFAAAGDFGVTSNTSGVLTGIAAQQPDLALALGDLSYGTTGAEQAWCDFVTARVGAGFPFELLAGNHESNGINGNINDFAACLPNQVPGLVGTYGRQWYVDVPRVDPLVRFVMISPDLTFPDGTTWSYAAGTPRYNWTASAIDGARSNGIPWVVVGAHKPCLSLGAYSCDFGTDLQQLMLTKRVDLVLHGHEHLYQRTDQLGIRTGCASVTPGAFDGDCIADGDNDMNQGAGTVFATVGNGGRPLRDANTSDAEVGYFAAHSALNVTPSHGFLDVRATADELAARFVATSGTFADSFTIRRGTPPPNQPPTASFTSSAQGLTASFDASGSRDDDGEVRSYAWDFGDGTTATGAKPDHAYSTAGTYQVELTVTDDDGATGSITQPVTVAQGPVDFAADSFSRTVTNGWGTANVGGAWSTSGTASNFSVAPQAGSLRLAAGTTLSAWLGATMRTDTDLRLTLSPDKVPNGSTYVSVAGRRVGTNNEYDGRIVLTSSGRVNISLTALRGSSTVSVIVPTIQLPITYSAGSQLNVRLQVTGTAPTTLRMKVWPATSPEPAAWQLTGTDNGSSLQSAGSVGVTAYLSSGVTNAPLVLRVSGLSARPTA
jgi:PKD repeat protein